MHKSAILARPNWQLPRLPGSRHLWQPAFRLDASTGYELFREIPQELIDAANEKPTEEEFRAHPHEGRCLELARRSRLCGRAAASGTLGQTSTHLQLYLSAKDFFRRSCPLAAREVPKAMPHERHLCTSTADRSECPAA